MKSIEQMAKEYADLIVTVGVNLYKGQSLLIKCAAENYNFARLIALSAYDKGAALVKIDIDDLSLLKKRLEVQNEKELKVVTDYSKIIDYEMMVKDWAYIRIDNTEDRHHLIDVDANKLSIYRSTLSENHTLYMQSRMRHENAWCVVCSPGPVWAKSILGESGTEEQLWHLLAPILKLDKEDPTQAWLEHNKVLKQRCNTLNQFKIKQLHFKSSKTDLTIGLAAVSRWKGGGDTLPRGANFMANIPTEEVFTTPNRFDVNGYVTTTRPVSVMESRVEDLKLTFKGGKVVDFKAAVGNSIMESFFSIDEGASYLGEVALVDENSPIAKSKQIFNSILYDENASCHLALGAGYPFCLENFEQYNEDELIKIGCNRSLVHTDFMIGSSDLDIEATTEDGKNIVIMQKGNFVI